MTTSHRNNNRAIPCNNTRLQMIEKKAIRIKHYTVIWFVIDNTRLIETKEEI
jgi:hypothetical protein